MIYVQGRNFSNTDENKQINKIELYLDKQNNLNFITENVINKNKNNNFKSIIKK